MVESSSNSASSTTSNAQRGIYWAFLIFNAITAVVLTVWVIISRGRLAFETPIMRLFFEMRSQTLTIFMEAVSFIGGVPMSIAIAAVVLLLLWRFAKDELLFFFVSLAGASAISASLKFAVARERPGMFPALPGHSSSTPAYPSGHATSGMALYLALYLIIDRKLPQYRVPFAIFSVLLVAGIVVSRLYIQAHYPTDIFGGLAMGIAWTMAVNLFLPKDAA